MLPDRATTQHNASRLPRALQCNLRDASRLCKHSWMRDALHAWVRRRGWADVSLDDTSDTSTLTTTDGDCFARSSAGEGSASSG